MAVKDEEYVDRGDFFENEDNEDDEEIETDQDEEEGLDGDSEDDDNLQDDEDADEDNGHEDEEEEVVPPKKEPRIPKSRFDDVNNRMKDATERNLWLEEQLEKLINQNTVQQKKDTPKVPDLPEYDYDAAEEQYISLIIEGEVGKATKLRNEINVTRQKELVALIASIENKSAESAKSQSFLLLEKERFENSITNMESKYPFLNHKDKAYNEEAVETVNTLLAGYLASGKGKVESLQLAIKKALPLYEKKITTKTTLG